MRRFVGALLTALVLILSACDFDAVVDAVDRFDLIIQLEPIETFAVGQVVDASTGELLDQDAEIRFEGADRHALVDFFGDPVESVRIRNGLFSIGVKPGITPTASAPIVVEGIVTAPGYESARRTITFRSTGERSFAFSLIPDDAMIEGTTHAMTSASATSSVVMETPRATSVQAGVGASIAANAWRYPDGSTASGDIAVRMRYHEGRASRALSALPDPVAVSPAGGPPMTVIAVGYASLTATSGSGRSLERLSEAAQRWVDLPLETTNPRTGRRFAAGDEIDVLLYDESVGAWSSDAVATLEQVPSKNGASLRARFESDRLGFAAFGSTTEQCVTGTRLNLIRNGHRGSIRLDVRSTNSSGYFRTERIPAGSTEYVMNDLPSGLSVTLTLHLSDGQTHTLTLSDACTGTATIALPAPRADVTDVTFSADFSCTLRLRPPFNATINYRRSDESGGGVSAGVPTWRTDAHGRVTGGSLVIPGMVLGESYRFLLVTPDEAVWHDAILTDSKVHQVIKMPSDLCIR